MGFPGETDQEFETLLDWLGEAQLDRVGCFKYSPVDGAAANDLPDAVPEDVKQARYDAFMGTQQAISRARLAKRVGTEIEVLVDEVGADGAIARSHADAPEIDGVVHVSDGQQLAPGQRVMVRVEGSDDYDLFARTAH